MKNIDYERPLLRGLIESVRKWDSVFHVMIGPRQVGKTTLAKQLAEQVGFPSLYASADSPLPPGPEWIEAQWRLAELRAAKGGIVLLILDELQKVRGWSEVLKRLWDAKDESQGDIRLLVLGSSALLVQSGLSESLAGRFYLHRCGHWSYQEVRAAFGWDLSRWLYFGGYPGAARFVSDEGAWRQYVTDSLIETVLAKDVFQTQKITKPTLMRHLFALAASYPAHILSYNKMLGQLQDAGNTTTLANYLRLLETAFLASGLESCRGGPRRRGSSPKLVLWNNALVNALSSRTYEETVGDPTWWGRIVENAVGAHLLGSLPAAEYTVSYWRDGDDEVDYVITRPKKTWAVEVKSGRSGKTSGLAGFIRLHPKALPMIVGTTGMPLEDFFSANPVELLR